LSSFSIVPSLLVTFLAVPIKSVPVVIDHSLSQVRVALEAWKCKLLFDQGIQSMVEKGESLPSGRGCRLDTKVVARNGRDCGNQKKNRLEKIAYSDLGLLKQRDLSDQ
jgi:hypothetical protein